MFTRVHTQGECARVMNVAIIHACRLSLGMDNMRFRLSIGNRSVLHFFVPVASYI